MRMEVKAMAEQKKKPHMNVEQYDEALMKKKRNS